MFLNGHFPPVCVVRSGARPRQGEAQQSEHSEDTVSAGKPGKMGEFRGFILTCYAHFAIFSDNINN